jgi:uncharacterized protein (TIRG00374 family)
MVGRSLRRLGIIAAFAVSLLFAFLAFHDVDWSETMRALVGANGTIVFLGAIVGLGGFVVRAFGWKFLLVPVEHLSGRRLFTPVAIGYMANNLLPARVGEFARAYVVGRRENVSKSAALATIVIERIFDGLTLLLILAVISLYFPFPPWVKESGALVAAALFLLAVALALVAAKIELVIRVIDLVVGPFLPGMAVQLKSQFRNFVVGLDLKNHYPTVLLALLFTFLRWTFEACIYLSVIYALGLEHRVPIHGALFVMVAVNIACMIPQAPGFIGSVQIACIQALSVFGIDRETAVAYSLLVHAAFFFPITIVGLVCLAQSPLTFAEIRKSGNTAASRDLAATLKRPSGKEKAAL